MVRVLPIGGWPSLRAGMIGKGLRALDLKALLVHASASGVQAV